MITCVIQMTNEQFAALRKRASRSGQAPSKYLQNYNEKYLNRVEKEENRREGR